MKSLTIAILFLSVMSYGQKDTSYDIGGSTYLGSSIIKEDTSYNIGTIATYYSRSIVTYDTVPVIMLICDTARVYDNYDFKVYWTKGYCIKSSNSYYVTYLDRFKRPLRKTTLVWTNKEY